VAGWGASWGCTTPSSVACATGSTQAQKSRWGLRSRRWLLRHEAQHVKGDAAAFTGFECPTRTSLGRGGSVMAITRCDSASATSKRQKQ